MLILCLISEYYKRVIEKSENLSNMCLTKTLEMKCVPYPFLCM